MSVLYEGALQKQNQSRLRASLAMTKSLAVDESKLIQSINLLRFNGYYFLTLIHHFEEKLSRITHFWHFCLWNDFYT